MTDDARPPVPHAAVPTLPPGATTRPLTLDDLDATFAVYAADEVADAGQLALEPEDLAGDWARPSFDLERDSVGVFLDGRLVGAAEVSRGGTRADGAVHPDARGRGIGTWLLAWTETRAAEQAAATTGQTVPQGSTAERVMRARGYRTGHTSWVLELPEGREIPSRPLPPGYRLGVVGSEEGERAAHRVIDEAFGDWSDRSLETFEDWAAGTTRRPGTQPWQLRVVETDDGDTVGVAFVILDSQGAGYVHQLAVDRRHRGRGLAQALLADAFAAARAHGASRSELSTDSRTGALDLYRKVGMEVTQTWVHLTTTLVD